METDIYTLAERVEKYIATLNEHAPEGYSFDMTVGRRYIKVVMIARGGGRSVHSFIEHGTGHIYKAAGWARPAEHVRFDLTNEDSYARLLEAAAERNAFAGGYLYIR